MTAPASSEQLGAFIRSRRLELGITQAQLARNLDLPQDGTIARVERGDGSLAAALIPRLAAALDVPVVELQDLAGRDPHTGIGSGGQVLDGGPYRGLSAFREVDSWIYFGRSTAVERLATKLEHTSIWCVAESRSATAVAG